MKVFIICGYDCKREEEFTHYDGFTEEIAIFTSKAKAQEYASEIGYGIPQHTYFVKETEIMK